MKFLIFLCVWCSGLVSTSVAVIVHKQSNNVSYVHTEQANSIQDVEHRNLADSPGLMGKDKKMNKVKLERMDRIVALAEKETFPGTIYKADWSVEHRFNENAILSAAMHPKATSEDANAFLGTLRKSGFTGDVVIAILPNSPVSFVNKVKEYNAITYFVPINCGEKENSISCSFEGHEFKASVNMIRYWVYQYWAALYSKDSILLLSDFFDVFFQSDPIAYRKNDWFPQNQLVVYQEAFPNMVIAREVFNAGWIRECYGEKALKQIESNTVSCSGSTMGTRDGILVYVSLRCIGVSMN